MSERQGPRGVVRLSGSLDGPTSEALAALIEALASQPGVRLEIDVTGARFSDPRVLMVLNKISRRRVRPAMALVTDKTVDPVPGPGASGGPGAGLTTREADVISKIATGLSNAEICERTYLSINSVKSYIRSAYGKMGVTSRTQAVLWGVENGLGPSTIQLQQASPPVCCHRPVSRPMSDPRSGTVAQG